jgi:hypothetical protein
MDELDTEDKIGQLAMGLNMAWWRRKNALKHAGMGVKKHCRNEADY